MDFAGLDVREKLDGVLLPEDAERPRLLRFDPASDAIIRLGVSGDLPLSTIRQWTEEDLKKDLDAVDGVAAVRIEGGLTREIQVDVDEGRLTAYGITVEEVRAGLAANNVNLAGGSVYEDEARYLVRTLNELDTLDRIGAVIVKDAAGRLVRVRDVAEVRSGFKDQEVILREEGAEGVEVRIFKEGDANTVRVAEGVRARLEEVEGSAPEGLSLAVLFDQSQFISGAISEVVRNAWEGGLLAILVIALFCATGGRLRWWRWRSPVSVVATFFVMQQMGLSLNIMSLGGLGARGRDAARRLHRGAGGDPPAARRRRAGAGGRDLGNGRGRRSGDRLHADHGRGLPAHRVRGGGRRPAFPGPGAHGLDLDPWPRSASRWRSSRCWRDGAARLPAAARRPKRGPSRPGSSAGSAPGSAPSDGRWRSRSGPSSGPSPPPRTRWRAPTRRRSGPHSAIRRWCSRWQRRSSAARWRRGAP